jgi:thiol-disulfide isomerase/thioredoxin
MQRQMRARGAPEARGFSFGRLGGTAIRAGALAFLTLAQIAALRSEARAEPVGNSPVRHLAAAPNAPLPHFVLPDLAGAPLRLEAQRGRVVLVHFFATWCEPCREELASLSRLQQGRWGERLAIVAVNVAEVAVRVRRFLDAAPVAFPVALDADRAVARAWGVAVLPTTFVLDPKLQPRLFVEGDLDWARPDILSALDAIGAAPPSEPATAGHTSTRRSQ